MQQQKKANGGRKKARNKIVLAYSGGLDTSIAIRWLGEAYDADVVAVLVDVGQPSAGFKEALDKAKRIGAVATYGVDAREEFARDFVAPAIQANALYEKHYPLATALARPLIAAKLVEVARKEGATAVAHGCTAKGNDQVRFEVSIQALAPDLRVIAPAREWVYTREEGIKWAAERDIPLPITKKSPYSIDENLWGRSAESGVLEDAEQEPPEDCYGWTAAPEAAPEKARYVTITFAGGVPVALDGHKMELADLIQALNAWAGEHGVGRIDHIENRLVGIKSREVYEAPAAQVLVEAHRQLESLVLPRDLVHFKYAVEDRFAELVYDGLWFTPLMESVRAFVAASQERVTGDVRVKLLKGAATVVGRSSPHSIYETSLATYGKGDAFNHGSAQGFIDLWGLPSRTYAARSQPAGLAEGATEKVSREAARAGAPRNGKGK
ncbi:MAG TPA: argininosuccinate synthase [Candidatus Thermoplasmatota archaeon]